MRPLGEVRTVVLVCVGVLGWLAGSSLHWAIRGTGVWVAAAVGVAIALGSLVVCVRAKLVAAYWLALSMAGLWLGGEAVAAVGISDGIFGSFGLSVVEGWTDLLSASGRVDFGARYVALPVVLAWLATMLGCYGAQRVRVPMVAAVGPVVVFGCGLLFAPGVSRLAAVEGGAMFVCALGLGWSQYGSERRNAVLGDTTLERRRVRAVAGVGLVVVAAVVASLVGPLFPGFDDRDRFDLRDRLDPPWNPLDEPSPLAGLKSNYQASVREEVAFVARGDVIPHRWAIATLGAFDGVVWTVGDSDIGGAAPFVPIDSLAPAAPDGDASREAAVEVVVEPVGLTGPWLPVPGRLEQISAASGLSEEAEVRFNVRTGTVAVPSGVQGRAWRISVRPWSLPHRLNLAADDFAVAASLGLDQQTKDWEAWSADLVQSAPSGWGQATRIGERLRSEGKYLDSDQFLPGHSWSRLLEVVDQSVIVGNAEQFAALGAIAARNSRLATRVVVGFVRGDGSGASVGELTMLREEASAWIEVRSTQFGWIPVDVTPDRNNLPTFEADPKEVPIVVLPPVPPPPPPEPAEAESLLATPEPLPTPPPCADLSEPECKPPPPPNVAMRAAAATAAVPVVLIAGWAAAVAVCKSLRRRLRKGRGSPLERVMGAWYETADRLLDGGVVPEAGFSVADRAVQIQAAVPEAVAVHRLRVCVEHATFSGEEVSDAEAVDAWSMANEVERAARSGVGWVTRVRRKTSLDSLRRTRPTRPGSAPASGFDTGRGRSRRPTRPHRRPGRKDDGVQVHERRSPALVPEGGTAGSDAS